ncbi:hypothetical protein [Azorhizobium sp. AG788]|uniref:hypothetical protein n=1 Tax=Azorhizobium sp. AG788 TaxID=2183897 RepID=UPI00313A1688
MARKSGGLDEKLARLALGNVDLVQEAIRKSTDSRSGKAGLGKIIAYIIEHRSKIETKQAA